MTADDGVVVLANPRKRRLLLALHDRDPGERLPVEVGDLHQVHLADLESLGFLEWDRAENAVSEGPAFDRIRPVLDVLAAQRSELRANRETGPGPTSPERESDSVGREAGSDPASRVGDPADAPGADGPAPGTGDRPDDPLAAFASAAAHDLRGPLTAAAASLDLARDRHGDLPELDTAAAALDRAFAVVDGTLALARDGEDALDRQPVRLPAVVEAAWTVAGADHGTLRVDDDLGSVDADPDQIGRLFGNLFENCVEHGSTGNRPSAGDSVEHSSTDDRPAADHDPERAPTDPRSAADGGVDRADPAGPGADGDGRRPAATPNGGTGRDPAVVVRVGTLDDAPGFFVEDDGPGVPPADRDRVFDAGVTTDETGDGLGLAIVERIATAHGWDVTLGEGEAGGARFEFVGAEVRAGRGRDGG